MGLISEIKALFEKKDAETTDIKFVDIKTADGMILRISDMAVGATVVEINEEGEVPVQNGSYTLEDGTMISVEGGLVTEITPKEVTEEMEMVETTLVDGTKVRVEGALEVGKRVEVYLNDEWIQAPEGQHTLADGTVIYVDAEGFVNEIETAETETTEEEMSEIFMDITLKDGPIAHIVTAMEGEIKAGDKMMLDGVEAGPGEYFTNDQKVIVVGDFGVISEVKDAPKEQTQEEREVQGVVNNLKELINQVKELKSQFENIRNENAELKERIEKFAAAPSDAPTKTKVDFNKINKEEKIAFFGGKR